MGGRSPKDAHMVIGFFTNETFKAFVEQGLSQGINEKA